MWRWLRRLPGWAWALAGAGAAILLGFLRGLLRGRRAPPAASLPGVAGTPSDPAGSAAAAASALGDRDDALGRAAAEERASRGVGDAPTSPDGVAAELNRRLKR